MTTGGKGGDGGDGGCVGDCDGVVGGDGDSG